MFSPISEAADSMAARAAGIEPGAALDGLDLGPLLRQPAARLGRDALFFHYPHYYDTTTPVSAVRARDWKLIEYHEDGRTELYNLREDPSETRNLAQTNTAQAAELLAMLRGWRERVGARMPTRA